MGLVGDIMVLAKVGKEETFLLRCLLEEGSARVIDG